MSKIKKISVENFKAVDKLTADFNGASAIVTGGNNKGKTTLLKGVPDRLRGNKPDIVLKYGEKEGFAELELTTGEKFVWTFNGKKEQLTFITEKNIKAPVTKELCKAYFPAVFDVDEFLNSTPAKQKKVLQELTGIDFSEIDKLYKEAYDNRTYANKRLAEEKVKFDAMPMVDASLPDMPLPTEELEKELAGIEAHNLRFETKEKEMIINHNQLIDNKAEIERLMAQIIALEDKNEVLSNAAQDAAAWMDEPKNKKKTNQVELIASIDEVRIKNKVIEENNKAVLQERAYQKAQENAAAADAEVKRIEAEKLDVIKNASMPEGFGFSEEGITYNDLAFNKDSLSSSSIYIAALKLAALNLGEVKTLHFDASYLTYKSLSEVQEWANANQLQLLIEWPDRSDGEITYELIQEHQ